MTDFEQGRDQALANVDAILLDKIFSFDIGSREYALLYALRERIKTLAPPATQLRLAGDLGVVEIDPDVAESL